MKIFIDEDANQLNILDERYYQSRKNKDVYYPGVTTILDAYYKGYGYSEWLKQVGYNADEIVKKAAEQGSNVHEMIENYLKGFEINWEFEGKQLYTLNEWKMFCKFIEFFETYKLEILAIEFVFCNEDLGFGGCIDLICRINDQIWLIDHKTSNYIHKTHELQISAYRTAWNALNLQYEIQRSGILWLNAATRGADKQGKKIQGKGWQLKEFGRNFQEAFRLFEHTQAIWIEEHPNYKPKNQIYPASFKLNK
jgi:hypothetical protein